MMARACRGRGRMTAALLAAAALAGAGAWGRTSVTDWGPLGIRYQDARGASRTRVAGPIVEWTDSTNGAAFAIRPLLSVATEDERKRREGDWLWPILVVRELDREATWRLVLFMGHDRDRDDPESLERTWLLPFWFQGINEHGEPYHALFPFGGTICNFLGRDEITFALWPFFTASRLDDIQSSTWLWPFISETHGDRVDRFRVFPFYGRSEMEGHYEKRFVLWPFWNDVEYTIPGSSGSGFILWPLVGRLDLEEEHTLWLLPPLFRFTEGKDREMVHCPWPLWQSARGKDYRRFASWPLFGDKQMPGERRSYALWPLVWRMSSDGGDRLTRRLIVAPCLTLRTTQAKVDGRPGEVLSAYRRLWPLWSYRAEGDESRTRVLELWPFREHDAVERNWAPLWTLYGRERKGDYVDHELLWGLFRRQVRGDDASHTSLFPLLEWDRDRSEEAFSWQVLKGLIGYGREGSNRTLRVLYFLRLGEDNTAETPEP